MAFFPKAKKFVKRVARKGKAVRRSKPFKRTAAVSKKLIQMAHLMNVEKKRLDIIASGIVSLGQCNVNASAYVANDITPVMSEGVTFSTRSGASIKIVSAYMKWMFWQQSANNHTQKIRIELWKVKGNTVTASTELQELYSVNPNTGLYDLNSLRNPDYYGGASKIYSKSFKIESQYASDIAIREVIIPLKLNHHIRFVGDTNTVADGQILLFMFSDSGNVNTITPSTLTNIPIISANTSVVYNQDIKWYYVDN